MEPIANYTISYDYFKTIVLNRYMPVLVPFFSRYAKMDIYYGESMATYLLKINQKAKLNPITFWDDFEISYYHYYPEFKKLLCTGYNICDDIVIAMEDRLFKLKYENFDNFIDNIYPDYYNLDFYQSTDFFFINCSQKKLILVHHSGY